MGDSNAALGGSSDFVKLLFSGSYAAHKKGSGGCYVDALLGSIVQFAKAGPRCLGSLPPPTPFSGGRLSQEP